MSNHAPTYHSRVSPEIWAAAKTRLPLRLPNPVDTGIPLDAKTLELQPRSRCKPVPGNHPAEIRRKVADVRSPLSDLELEAMAQRVLLQSGVRGFTRLHVEVRESVATLYGKLPTDIERQIVMQLVRRVNGISRVDQEISVDETALEAKRPVTSPSPKKFGWWLLGQSAVLSMALLGMLVL